MFSLFQSANASCKEEYGKLEHLSSKLIFKSFRLGVQGAFLYAGIVLFNTVASTSPAYLPVTNHVADAFGGPVAAFIHHLQDRADDSDLLAAFEQGIPGVNRDVAGRILDLPGGPILAQIQN